jgi:RNA polymerase sigma-70 factor (ECF subfamily)
VAGDRELNRESHFLRLLETYTRPLRRLCAAYMADPSDRQDLFQEIAMALWTALPRYRATASERTWLYRVAHNVALTYASKWRRQHGSERPIEETMCDAAGTSDSRRLALLLCVRKLESVDRGLVILYLEGFSGHEMEDITGMTANNIAVRLTRLRRKLACALNTKGGVG